MAAHGVTSPVLQLGKRILDLVAQSVVTSFAATECRRVLIRTFIVPRR